MVDLNDNLGYVPVQRIETSDLALGGNEINSPNLQLKQLASRDKFLLDRVGGGDTVAQDSFDSFKRLGIAAIAQGRLTLATGDPNPANDVTAATTLFYTPSGGNQIALWDAGQSRWEAYTFTQRSLSLSGLLANTNYDIFMFDNSGTLTLEAVAWSNSGAGTSSRASSLTRQDGVFLKASDLRRFLGTIRTVSAGQSEDSRARRFVWNARNRVPKILLKQFTEVTLRYSYTTAAWRSANADNNQRVQVVTGDVQAIQVQGGHLCTTVDSVNVSPAGSAGIGFNRTNANDAQVLGNRPETKDQVLLPVYCAASLTAGHHFFQLIEFGFTNIAFNGDSGDQGTAGLTAVWEC